MLLYSVGASMAALASRQNTPFQANAPPSGASVQVSWDAVSGATSYRVYYGTNTGLYDQAFGSGINVGNVTTYTINGLSPGVTYYIAVTASDGSNESDFGNEITKVAA